MKNSIALFLFTVLNLGLSNAPLASGKLELRCQQTSPKYGTAVLTFTIVGGGGELREGVVESHRFELFSCKNKIVSTMTISESADVMFSFKTTDVGIQGSVYMDELNQTTLTIGRLSSQFNCNLDE